LLIHFHCDLFAIYLRFVCDVFAISPFAISPFTISPLAVWPCAGGLSASAPILFLLSLSIFLFGVVGVVSFAANDPYHFRDLSR
jgi:hypothetical protein